MAEWEDVCGDGHVILQGDGFHISYNPNPLGYFSLFAADNGGDETALVGERYWILNGDWRKEFEEVFDQGIEACMDVFEKLSGEHKSSWSD